MASSSSSKKKHAVENIANMTQEEKTKALSTTIANIEKNYGKGSIMKMGDKPASDVPIISTGLLSVDMALGIGGVPRGRIIEIYGPEGSGKTTICLQIVAQAQAAKGVVGYIDAEHALDPVYAKNLGVDVDELYISQPDDGEQALGICETMILSGAVDLIVVDSVAALVPRSEIDGEMGQSSMGVQARLMAQALRKLTGFVNKNNCTLIFINQLRDKIGGMPSHGPSETTTGGRALKFFASVRIDIRKMLSVKNSAGDVTGTGTKIKITKNKLAPPFKVCEMEMVYGKGISPTLDILNLASEIDVVDKSGAWYSYNGTRIGQGKETTRLFLEKNPHICREIENKVRENYGFAPLPVIEATETAEEVPDDKAPKKKPSKKKAAKNEETELPSSIKEEEPEPDEIDEDFDESEFEDLSED
ncbi:protein RecA [Clostridia bacterium]|nr:protein RecA [Clostridia bacterium]